MKFLRKYCKSENGLRKLFTDAASLECNMLAMIGDIHNNFKKKTIKFKTNVLKVINKLKL